MAKSALPVPTSMGTEGVARLAEYQAKAKGARSENTEPAPRADTSVFIAWCLENVHSALLASSDTGALVDLLNRSMAVFEVSSGGTASGSSRSRTPQASRYRPTR